MNVDSTGTLTIVGTSKDFNLEFDKRSFGNVSKRVLVVDDSRFVFEKMKHSLRDSDFEIVGYCICGEEVVESYGKLLPDVVTMEYYTAGYGRF